MVVLEAELDVLSILVTALVISPRSVTKVLKFLQWAIAFKLSNYTSSTFVRISTIAVIAG